MDPNVIHLSNKVTSPQRTQPLHEIVIKSDGTFYMDTGTNVWEIDKFRRYGCGGDYGWPCWNVFWEKPPDTNKAAWDKCNKMLIDVSPDDYQYQQCIKSIPPSLTGKQQQNKGVFARYRNDPKECVTKRFNLGAVTQHELALSGKSKFDLTTNGMNIDQTWSCELQEHGAPLCTPSGLKRGALTITRDDQS